MLKLSDWNNFFISCLSWRRFLTVNFSCSNFSALFFRKEAVFSFLFSFYFLLITLSTATFCSVHFPHCCLTPKPVQCLVFVLKRIYTSYFLSIFLEVGCCFKVSEVHVQRYTLSVFRLGVIRNINISIIKLKFFYILLDFLLLISQSIQLFVDENWYVVVVFDIFIVEGLFFTEFTTALY